MSKRNRSRRPARRESVLEPKPTILVLSEGLATEPDYLNGFVQYAKNSRVSVEVVGGAGVPRTIVESAKDRKKENEKQARREGDDNVRYDQVWCVFDIDNHPNIPDAKQMARDNGIELAISNPCVEIWLWLHFADQPGMRDRHELVGMLKKYLPSYDKHVRFDDFKDGYSDAVRRAIRLEEDAQRAKEEHRNPSTGFWRLTEKILKSA